jgi:hypothetical protein
MRLPVAWSVAEPDVSVDGIADQIQSVRVVFSAVPPRNGNCNKLVELNHET